MSLPEGSLAQQLAQQFANSAPVFSDPEDDIGNETIAKVTSDATKDVPNESSQSTLRRKASALLADEDNRYAGKTVSRRALLSEGIESDSESISNDERSVGTSDEEIGSDDVSEELEYEFTEHPSDKAPTSVNEVDSFYDVNSEKEESGEEEGSEEDGESDSYYNQFDMDLSAFAKGTRLADESTGDDSLAEASGTDSGEDEETGVETLRKTEPSDEVKRGQSVQHQIKLWEALLEVRIELQKLLNASNQLPQHDIWDQLCEEKSADSQKLSLQTVEEVEDSCLALSSELLSLQTALEGTELAQRGVKRSLDDMEQVIGEQYEISQIKRNDVIQKWDDKTRLSLAATAKRKSVDHTHQSTLKQIEHILADKNRLTTRVHQNRSNLEIIGRKTEPLTVKSKEDKSHDSQPSETGLKSDGHERLNVEIFNDDDFYHQLLRELIEQKTNKTDDPIAMSRQWLEFQALRKKIKRTVDTRASKGRKLRYNVMPKLVNFMAPIISAEEWDDDRKDELFASLFDKKPEYKVVEEPSDVVILA